MHGDDRLDWMFAAARVARQDTARAEYGFETRLLARLRVERELRLNADQCRQVLAALEDAQRGVRTTYVRVRPELGKILSNSNKKIRAVLRPDQPATFDRIFAERRARGQEAARTSAAGRSENGSAPSLPG